MTVKKKSNAQTKQTGNEKEIREAKKDVGKGMSFIQKGMSKLKKMIGGKEDGKSNHGKKPRRRTPGQVKMERVLGVGFVTFFILLTLFLVLSLFDSELASNIWATGWFKALALFLILFVAVASLLSYESIRSTVTFILLLLISVMVLGFYLTPTSEFNFLWNRGGVETPLEQEISDPVVTFSEEKSDYRSDEVDKYKTKIETESKETDDGGYAKGEVKEEPSADSITVPVNSELSVTLNLYQVFTGAEEKDTEIGKSTDVSEEDDNTEKQSVVHERVIIHHFHSPPAQRRSLTPDINQPVQVERW